MATPNERTAKKIIDEAIREGRKGEWLCDSLVVLFVRLGIALVAVGLIQGSGLTILGGSIFTGWFWPALQYADTVRRDLARTRLDELPLTGAKAGTFGCFPQSPSAFSPLLQPQTNRTDTR